MRVLPCGHSAHLFCLDSWLKQNNRTKRCPLCQTKAETKFLESCGQCEGGQVEFEYTGKISEVFFVFGRSLGSASASALAAINPENLRGVIFESSFGNIKRMMSLVSGRFPEINLELLNPFSNDTYLAQIKKPCLVIHGERDQIIPFSEGKYVFEAIPESVDKEFIGIPSATHNNISSFEGQYFSPIKKFIEKYGK